MSRVEAARSSVSRILGVLFTSAFILTVTGQLLPANVGAAGQITARSITMSTSAASTTATYTLKFTPVTTAQELIVDFCANDPLISDSCTFAAGTVPTIASPVSSVGTAAAVGSGSPVHTIKVTGLTETGGSPFTISFTSGVTNPTTNTSFYARVLTYGTGGAASYTPANTSGNTPAIGSPTDTGGVALSTAANISITSKVFETLSYCVTKGGSCGTAPTINLGDATTGALSSSTAYVNSDVQYQIATNAASGASVTMTGTTLCRPGGTCTTGTNAFTISAIGASALVSATNSEQFGLCVNTTGGNGGLAAQSPYNDTGTGNNCNTGIATGPYSGSSKFALDDTTGGNGSNGASGTKLLQSTGAISTYLGNFAFLGNIAATTEAGIYSTTLNTVATGTF